MILPFSTDAPIYHFPWATLGIIAANIAIHALGYAVPEEVIVPYALKLGDGLHPNQWLTNNFLHMDLMHLGFNMLFLWAYGIIVEGKIGWWRFLLCYVAIGTLYGGSIQAAYLGASKTTYVLGASAIIFGLMAMAMIWAPVNELTGFYLFIVGFRIIANTFEMKIYLFALLQLALEGLSVGVTHFLKGDPLSSALLHLSGAFWGIIAGVFFLKVGWVDCEGFDVFSIRRKRRELGKAWRDREKRLERGKQTERLSKAMRAEEDRPGLTTEERSAKILAKIHKAIEIGDMDAASASFSKWIDLATPPRDALRGVIEAMHRRKEWAASIRPMRAFCRLYPAKCDKLRLMLASLLLRELQRPTEARRQLDLIVESNLDDTMRRLHLKLLKQADAMIEDGVLEIEEEV